MIELAFAKTLHSPSGKLELDIHTTIEAGNFTTLSGPSGAGKTTVLRILAGLAQPDRGHIVVNGETWFDSQRHINLSPQHRSIGFVFQDYALFPNLNVRQNVGYAAKDSGWVESLLDMMGLMGFQERLPATLSGGQKQRVALARALAKKPRLLLLDEALSALDTPLRVQLQDDLLRLHQQLGLTTLLVSHDLGEVFKLSQRVLKIEQGRITQSGTPSEVFLHRRIAKGLQLHAQVLDMRKEEVVHILSVLIGQDIVEMIASEEEVAGLKQGDTILVSSSSFSPVLSASGSFSGR